MSNILILWLLWSLGRAGGRERYVSAVIVCIVRRPQIQEFFNDHFRHLKGEHEDERIDSIGRQKLRSDTQPIAQAWYWWIAFVAFFQRFASSHLTQFTEENDRTFDPEMNPILNATGECELITTTRI